MFLLLIPPKRVIHPFPYYFLVAVNSSERYSLTFEFVEEPVYIIEAEAKLQTLLLLKVLSHLKSVSYLFKIHLV